ncbi:MAG: glycoside hydrolase family 76 protein [Fimbriimonadaceae bacterium]
MFSTIIAAMAFQPSNQIWQTRAEQALTFIETNFWRADHYIQSPTDSHPAYMWDLGMQFSALAAASKINEKYISAFDICFKSIEPYWNPQGPTPGYDVKPNPKDIDRYYDDNAWVALALLEQYETTKNSTLLMRAIETHDYVMSGWDNQLDGGIYWREAKKESKHACSNGPAALTALKLYQATNDRKYLAQAQQIIAWLDATLRDSDGLYFDNMDSHSQIQRTKWSYNTALPIQTHLMLYQINQTEANLKAAQQSVDSAIKFWVGPSGEIKDDAGFAVHLVDALFAFNEPKYTAIAERAVEYAYQNTRTKEGFYANRWDRPNPEKPGNLLAQASAARAFSLLAAKNSN